MNKLELIHYLQSLLATCNTLYDLQEKLIEDEIVEKADIKMREEKDIADDKLNGAYKSNWQKEHRPQGFDLHGKAARLREEREG